MSTPCVKEVGTGAPCRKKTACHFSILVVDNASYFE